MSEPMSDEEMALTGLGLLGSGKYFRAPNVIVHEGGLTEPADRSVDAPVLDVLVGRGFAFKHPILDAYGLTPTGMRRAAEIALRKMPMQPLEALAVLLQFSGGVAMQKASPSGFRVQVVRGETMYVAMNEDLGAAILEVKAQLDKLVFGG